MQISYKWVINLWQGFVKRIKEKFRKPAPVSNVGIEERGAIIFDTDIDSNFNVIGISHLREMDNVRNNNIDIYGNLRNVRRRELSFTDNDIRICNDIYSGVLNQEREARRLRDDSQNLSNYVRLISSQLEQQRRNEVYNNQMRNQMRDITMAILGNPSQSVIQISPPTLLDKQPELKEPELKTIYGYAQENSNRNQEDKLDL